MVARYGERHSISLEEGGYPTLDGVGEGIFGASHGYYGMGIRLCVCDVKEGNEGEPLCSGFHSWLMSLLDLFPYVSPTK